MRPTTRLIWLIFTWLIIAVTTAILMVAEFAFAEYFPSISEYALKAWYGFGLLIMVSLLVDLFSLPTRSSISIERNVSHNLPVDADTQVKLHIKNNSNRHVSLFISDHYPEHSEVTNLPFNIVIPSNNFAIQEYSLRVFRRGDAKFDQVRCLASSRLGLWQKVLRYGKKDTVKVYPNFAAIHHYILLSADQQTTQMGIRRSQRRGDGLEFHQLREYRIGDSIRQIDWRATSRLQKLISREYQEEKDQNIIFLIDSGRRMRTKDGHISHFDHSLNAMLLLAYISLKQGDAVGLLSFAGYQRWLSPQKGTQHINTLLNQVYDCHPTTQASDFIEAATELNKRIRKRALVVLVSNLRDEDITELNPAITLLNQHHLVMVANLREHALDDVIQQPINSLEEALNYSETVEYLRHRKKIHENLSNKGVISIDCTPKDLATRVVNSYFEVKRSGRL